MYTDLRTSIYSVGKTVSGSNGFYYATEPQDVTYPYVVYYIPTDPINRLTNDEVHSMIIQFSLYDRRQLENGNLISSTTLEKVAEELMSKFESASLSVSNYRIIDKRIQFVRPAIVVNAYWQIVLQYNLIFEKTN